MKVFNNAISKQHPLYVILPDGGIFIIKDGLFNVSIVTSEQDTVELYNDPSPFRILMPEEVHLKLHTISEKIEFVEKGGMKKFKQFKEKERRNRLKNGGTK